MSTKGLAVSESTRRKISLSKLKFTKEDLIQSCNSYLELFSSPETQPSPTPTIAGLCLHTGITYRSLYEYTERFPEVGQLLDFIKLLQEDMLVTGGLTNTLNSKFATFLLDRKLGYAQSPATPSHLVQNNQFNLTPEILSEAINLARGN